jgi:hypothetical protein
VVAPVYVYDVIAVVPDAMTVVGVAEASPNTVQAYDARGPPPYAQFQVGCAEVEPCTPANEDPVTVTVGAVVAALDFVSEIEAVVVAFVIETVIL